MYRRNTVPGGVEGIRSARRVSPTGYVVDASLAWAVCFALPLGSVGLEACTPKRMPWDQTSVTCTGSAFCFVFPASARRCPLSASPLRSSLLQSGYEGLPSLPPVSEAANGGFSHPTGTNEGGPIKESVRDSRISEHGFDRLRIASL